MRKERSESSFYLTGYLDTELCRLIILPFCHLQTSHPWTYSVVTQTPGPCGFIQSVRNLLDTALLGSNVWGDGGNVRGHLEILLLFKTRILNLLDSSQI